VAFPEGQPRQWDLTSSISGTLYARCDGAAASILRACALRKSSLPPPAPIRRVNLQNLILDRLSDYVLTHGLSADDRLPPERELAAQLKVSRPTLRGALHWLCTHGAVRRIQGGGTYLEPRFLAVMSEHSATRQTRPHQPDQIAEARLHLEMVAARLAARRPTHQANAQLRSSVTQTQRKLSDAHAWHQHELKFHLHVARMTHNPALAEILEPLISQSVAILEATSATTQRAVALDEHRNIVAALEAHDAEAAARRMQRHLNGHSGSDGQHRDSTGLPPGATTAAG
jgi:GntR family transcriptional repressor for pyruvate dehydrogenase complex